MGGTGVVGSRGRYLRLYVSDRARRACCFADSWIFFKTAKTGYDALSIVLVWPENRESFKFSGGGITRIPFSFDNAVLFVCRVVVVLVFGVGFEVMF